MKFYRQIDAVVKHLGDMDECVLVKIVEMNAITHEDYVK